MKFENIYRETEENMRLALLSLWAPGTHPLRKVLNELFDREPLLAEPVFQSTFGWEPTTDVLWKNSLNSVVIEKLGIGVKYPPYKHQVRSWSALAEGKSIVVTSGTGSGKTECFMYPVLSDLYEQGHPHAIEAIFLYPLNALMEDQKKRLSQYCKATGLHFAVYNGDTPENKKIGELLPNEIGTREEIRNSETRPEILLTNPSMLEYILVRKRDQGMLQESAGKLRWIVIDEVHSYSGSAAVELAFQIKRILEAFGTSPEQVRFACTSATVGGKEGAQSLAQYISIITGQAVQRIEVIGGSRLVKNIDSYSLSQELKANNLPSVERVLTLRRKINEVSGLSLQQMWEWLCPNLPYGKERILPALQLLDKLCEMSQDGIPVLSLRAHFFMRAISGLYACANENCSAVNPSLPIYGHLTTYKASVCPHCGAPLLELVQCKCCKSFILMGTSDSQSKKILPCEDAYSAEDYFAIDSTTEEDDQDEFCISGSSDKFFLLPYDKEKFFVPIDQSHFQTLNIVRTTDYEVLETRVNDDGKWVDVRKDDKHSYCPSCGKLAQGKRLNFKHFRIPINFINQTISPVLLSECAPKGYSWGKYIAFTDSRQGTAISAKTFNVNVERSYSYAKMLDLFAKSNDAPYDLSVLKTLPQEVLDLIIQKLGSSQISSNASFSLYKVSEEIFNEHLFEHLSTSYAYGVKDSNEYKQAYKAALIRYIIGRKPVYETNAETMGLIQLYYPSLDKVKVPIVLSDFCEHNNVKITEQDWRNFLKLSIDYVMRLGNHIQPLMSDERKYVRDGNISTPIAAPNDTSKKGAHWPSVKIKDGTVSPVQPRLVTLLCAGLGIHTYEQLRLNARTVDAILLEAWNDLVEKKILTKVGDDREGYNNPKYFPDGRYLNSFYVDLSGKEGNNVCKVKKLSEAWVCPVTYQILDTTFCGYSPLINGRLCEKLCAKYKCGESISMPSRPKDDEEVERWQVANEEVDKLKSKGLWNDRHKYVYHKPSAYIAAEHSAQQSKSLLRKYTNQFSQPNPALNVLHCSTTMEMGVDIGDIDVVLMDTVPPTAANYLQRVGRAGRMGQTKAIAFSLCNNTPVGQNAFANPMWALQTTNYMSEVRPSNTIIQRHINSFFFRQFICKDGVGIQANIKVDEFMSSTCDDFVLFLEDLSVSKENEKLFHQVFGENISYSVDATKASIVAIQSEYKSVVKELSDAFNEFNGNDRRQMAISNQLRKVKSEGLLKYISEHQFIPNANMPIGVVSFDFTDKDQRTKLNKLYKEFDSLKVKYDAEQDAIAKSELSRELDKQRNDIEEIRRSTSASRDIRTALNEYAPEQTVVINEKNYVSAGILLLGAYNEKTQSKAIYHCKKCGHTEYSSNLAEGRTCPICGECYHSIIDSNTSSYTLAYEPVGFCTDENVDGSREENTDSRFYDIRPILLDIDWSQPNTGVNMCEIFDPGEKGNILYYNVGNGHGFAFCKRCGRAAVENTVYINSDSVPDALKPGHKSLLYKKEGNCEAAGSDIARHVVFTGNLPTCYAVLKFKNDAGSSAYVNDQQLVYSLGVVIKRALALYDGIDENEIDFGIKQEQNAWVLFVFDAAKGGCGYSRRLIEPIACQEVLDLAKQSLESSTCNCHVDGGACARCLVDRTNYRYAHLLSKAKVLDWLNRQKIEVVEIPEIVKNASPSAKVVCLSLKDILKQAINDPEVNRITLCVSDLTNDTVLTEWASVRSLMGKYINTAVLKRKSIAIRVEFHPELHTSLSENLPFIDLGSKFTDCNVCLVQDMGELKTALIVESTNKLHRYFTIGESALSFSNNWGSDDSPVFADDNCVSFVVQEEPTFQQTPSEIVREGLTCATSFPVKNYFSKAIESCVLKPQDKDLLSSVLCGKHVNITYSDMYVNSALASLMLVYLIKEMRDLYGFEIDTILLQFESKRRKWYSENFNEWQSIDKNFRSENEADEYTETLIKEVLNVDSDISLNPPTHHRWLQLSIDDGSEVVIRPDHGISGGYKSDSRYVNLESLNENVVVKKNDEDVLYYVIIRKASD